MCEILTSVEFWKFAIPLFGAVIAWFINEWRKRIWEQYKRKEEQYNDLIRCLKGFYQGLNYSPELQAEFIDRLNRCWLYCPDDVIKKGYEFLASVHKQNLAPSEIKFEKMGSLVSAIRRDLISRRLVRSTSLSGKDFQHLEVSNQNNE